LHTPGRFMYTADTLSRAPSTNTTSQFSTTENEVEAYVLGIVSCIQVADNKQVEIREETSNDRVMKLLVQTIMSGWAEDRSNCHKDLLPFWNFRDELSVINGMIFKGTRVIISNKLRSTLLQKIPCSTHGNGDV